MVRILPNPQAIQRGIKVRLEPFSSVQPVRAQLEEGIARAHNLLSSAEYILYTTRYSSLTLVERGGAWAVAVSKWW
jgi:hypothetical protein